MKKKGSKTLSSGIHIKDVHKKRIQKRDLQRDKSIETKTSKLMAINGYSCVAEMMNPPRMPLQDICDALTECSGFPYLAAKRLGVHYITLRSWIANIPELQEHIKTIEEKQLDLVESKALQLVKAGDKDMIKFFLKCKGRKRGWVETVINEIDASGLTKNAGDMIQILITPADGSPQQIVNPVSLQNAIMRNPMGNVKYAEKGDKTHLLEKRKAERKAELEKKAKKK